jgi:hypothetical protein
VVNDPAAVCYPGTVDLTLSAVTAGSSLEGGTLSYWEDVGATTALAAPAAVSASGTYYIKAETGAGCFDIEPVLVTINPLPDPPIANNLTTTFNCIEYQATATAPAGASLVWFDNEVALTQSPVQSGPKGTNEGTYTKWVESVDGETGCISATRTEVVLTINPVQLCADYNGDVFVNTDTDGNPVEILVSIYADGNESCDDLESAVVNFEVTTDIGGVGLTPSGSQMKNNDNGIMTYYQKYIVDLGQNEFATIDVVWAISGNYTSEGCGDNKSIVTVSKPTDEKVTGGGYIISDGSQGSKAALDGKKTNFGFNVEWAKNFRRLKGNVNIIWRQDDFGFQARSNSASGLNIVHYAIDHPYYPGGWRADIEYSNVNMKKLCDYCWSDGNGQIILTVIDMAEPGNTSSNSDNAVPDWIGIVVKDKNGNLIYSSNTFEPIYNTSVLQQLNGGNIQVHADKGGDGDVDDDTDTGGGRGKKKVGEIGYDEVSVTELSVFPNPTNGPVTFRFSVDESVMTTVDIYSSSGKLVRRAFEGYVEPGDLKAIQLDGVLAKGFYYIRLRAGDDLKVARLVVSDRY